MTSRCASGKPGQGGASVLVLTRKLGEGIAIGDDIKIVVMQIKGKQVRLGIKAASSTVVHREEIYQKIHEENKLAAEAQCVQLDEVCRSLPIPEISKTIQDKVPLRTRSRIRKTS